MSLKSPVNQISAQSLHNWGLILGRGKNILCTSLLTSAPGFNSLRSEPPFHQGEEMRMLIQSLFSTKQRREGGAGFLSKSLCFNLMQSNPLKCKLYTVLCLHYSQFLIKSAPPKVFVIFTTFLRYKKGTFFPVVN